MRHVRFLIRSLVELSTRINLKLCIGIWNWKIYWLTMIRPLELWILDCPIPIRQGKGWKLHVGRRVMPRRKWLMERSRMSLLWWIYGRRELYFMQWCVASCRLRIRTRENSTRRSWAVNIPSQATYPATSRTSSKKFSQLTLKSVSVRHRWSNIHGGDVTPSTIAHRDWLLDITRFLLTTTFWNKWNHSILTCKRVNNLYKPIGTIT